MVKNLIINDNIITLFLENGNKLIIDRTCYKKLGRGMYGGVYTNNDIECIKVFDGKLNAVSFNGSRETHKLLNKIRSLKLNNFYVIKDLLYTRKPNILKKGFAGYTMDKYENIDIDLLYCPINYLIDNYTKLREDFITLSKNNIRVRDLHTKNLILTKNKIIIIDVDNYNLFRTNNMLLELNLKDLNNLFISLLRRNIFIKHERDIDIKEAADIINELFFEYDITKLSKYNNLYEYIIEKIKENKERKR